MNIPEGYEAEEIEYYKSGQVKRVKLKKITTEPVKLDPDLIKKLFENPCLPNYPPLPIPPGMPQIPAPLYPVTPYPRDWLQPPQRPGDWEVTWSYPQPTSSMIMSG